MPIYEYQCKSCGKELEVIQKISDPVLTDCPACGEPALKKKVSAAAFRLKGGGWYETDFKAGDKKNLAGDSAKGDGKAGDGGGAESGKDTAAGADKASGGKDSKTKTGDGGGNSSPESKKTA